MSHDGSDSRFPLPCWKGPLVALWFAVLVLAAVGSLGGCIAMNAHYWGKSGGGFVRVFGDAGPQKPFGPGTVSEWMAQPRPQP